MTEIYYLVDTNALSKMGAERRRSALVQTRCRLPAEVLHEATGFPDHADLARLEQAMSVETLNLLRCVMETVPNADGSLVNLYHNRGNADPILVASALDLIHQSRDTLFEEDWRIVSDDGAVRRKAAEFNIVILSAAKFMDLIDALDGSGS